MTPDIQAKNGIIDLYLSHWFNTSGITLRHFLWLVFALSNVALAIDPTEHLAELSRTCWATRDGAPADGGTIAQSADGTLWLGSSRGLYRFDGEHFELFRLPDGTTPITTDVSALYASNNGWLWVGMRFGQAYSIHDGVLRAYGPQDGLPTHSVWQFAQRDDGTVWVQTTVGLFLLRGDKWEAVGADWGYPSRQGWSLLTDRNGALWSYTTGGAFVLRRDANKFERLAAPGGIGELFSAPNGDVWVADHQSGLINLSHPEQRISGRLLGGSDAATDAGIFDRDGGLWVSIDRGNVGALARFPNAARELANAAPNLAGMQILKQPDNRCDLDAPHFLEDREGNLWVPAGGGVLRFRDNKLHSVMADLPSPIDWPTMTVDSAGTVWLLGWRSVAQFAPGRNDPITLEHAPMMGKRPSALWRESDGSFLVARDGAPLVHYVNGKLHPVAMDPALQRAGVQAITRDAAGTLWVSAIRSGLFQQQGKQWIRNGGLSGLPTEPPLSMTKDGNRLWLGYVDGHLGLIERGQVRLLGAAEGLQVGPVAVVTTASDGNVWVGGPAGVAVYSGERFWKLETTDSSPLLNVSGLVRDRNGGLWANGASGVTYITAPQITAFLEDHSHKVSSETYNYEDGMGGSAAIIRPLPTAVMGGDGRIWFATLSGVYWIDPQHIRRNPLPPPVVINNIIVGDRRYSTTGNVVLPALTRSFEVDYAALSLSMPSRVRFKYFLEGVDPGWQNAGTRRQAFYTNVPPGEHRFHVTASNEDGVWNPTGTEASIVIPPAFYQTRWFYAVLSLAALLLVWQLLRLRMSQIEKRLRVRLEEREAIARELHDTLLQSTQGLIYRFQSLAEQVDSDSPLHAEMESALDRAEGLLNEARDRVTSLRKARNEYDVEAMIRHAAVELFSDTTTHFSMVRTGNPKPLRATCAEEVYYIAREALTNVRRHAQASCVEVEIEFALDRFRLDIRDDGCGMDAQAVARESGHEHFGNMGMRERARQLGAKIVILSREAAGTEMELVVPAATAYLPTTWRALKALQLWRPGS
jgi:signal transduction histidine kinase/ligand-binding sensor domain-containing protein